MNWRQKQLRFAIRKLKVAVASTVVGLAGLGVMAPVVAAQESAQIAVSQPVNYRYVLEAELTAEEKERIVSQLPEHDLGDYETYYMVYRPITQLPQTGQETDFALGTLGAGLLVLGLVALKGKKKRIVVSMTLLSLGGAVSVSALPIESRLSTYDQTYSLRLGDELPETVLDIPNHEFIGYLLPEEEQESNSLPQDSAKDDREKVEDQQAVNPIDAPVEVITTNESLVSVAEETMPAITEVVQELAFETIYQEDPTLELGQEVVLRAGQLGQQRLQYRGDTLLSQEILVEPVAQIVARGTKSEPVEESPLPESPKPVTSVVTEAVAFETEMLMDETLPLGEEVILQEGAPGLRENTYMDGQLVGSRLLQAPVNRLIKKGSLVQTEPADPEAPELPAEPVETRTTEEVPYELEVLADETLALGEEVLVQEGVPGLREVVYLDGQLVSSQLAQAPVARIVKRGTKPVEAEIQTVQEELPFETLYQEDETLPEGQVRELQAGVPGLVEKTVRDGELISQITIREAVPRIVARGTKKAVVPVAGQDVDVERIVIPSPEVTEDDATLWSGERDTSQGADGEKEVTTTYETLDGVRQPNPTVLEVVTKEPIPTVVKVGTKPIEGQVTKTRVEAIAFDTETVEDSDQYTDYRTETGGQAGEKTITEVFKTIKGQETEELLSSSEEVTLPAVDKIITVGTKPIEGTITRQTTEPIPFKETVQYDPTRLNSTPERVIQEGQEGLRTITKTYKTVKGEIVGEAIRESSEITKEAENHIIERGSKNLTEADQQTPVAIKQTVPVNAELDPQASLSPGLSNVASYSWKEGEKPSTAQIAQNIPGTVLVTYTDASMDEVPVRVDVIQEEKTKPTLVLSQLIEHDDEKKITLNYDLTDLSQAYIGAVVDIYDGDKLVKTQNLTTFDDFDMAGLDWHIPYTLKTTMTYNVGNGNQTQVLEDVPFELDYKKVEIKHVDRVELYEKQADGSYRKLDRLTTKPTDHAKYYAKVMDSQQRDIYLSVKSSEEANVDGNTVYKLTATAPQLIEYSGEGTDNQEDYHFYVPKFVPSANGKYTTFEDLVTAMRANPAGTFELAEDLEASDFVLPAGATSYIPEVFSGKLLGANHSISGLKAPLFNKLNGAFTVSDLDLKNVAINQPNVMEIGALAKQADARPGKGRVTNVAVQGNITGERLVGGLVYLAWNTAFENISFEGNITTTTNWQVNISGGLVGYLRGESTIDKAKVDANITVNAAQNPGSFHIGAISGAAEVTPALAEGNIRNVVAQGKIQNVGSATANVAGLVGSTTANTRIRNAVSSVQVTNGKELLAKSGSPLALDETVVQIAGTSSTQSEGVPTKTRAEAQTQIDAMGITVSTADTDRKDLNQYDVDYSKVAGYQANNQLKYTNTEKLLPFYNKEFIVKEANRLPEDHALATKTVVSVIPMADQKFVSDYANEKSAINKIMVYFADGSKAEYAVTYLENFKDTGIAEYQLDGLDMLYTPEQILTHYPHLVSQILPTLKSVEYHSSELLTALGRTGNATEMMDKLYLKESFEAIKENLPSVLNAVLSTSNVIATDRTDLADYIVTNKEALLMGLAYVNRWFNIDFGQVNAKELILYHQDIFGKATSTLDWLISIGKDYDQLRMINHLATYKTSTEAHTGQESLFDYLSFYRQLFTEMDENTWFKSASKAYIVEGQSLVRPDVDVRAYHKLLNDTQARHYILPLLSAREGIFYISNMSTINFGMYDRYVDMTLKETNPSQYAEEVAKIKAKVDQANIRFRDHFDFWYRMSLDTVKERNIKAVPNWDGYQINREGLNKDKWLNMTGDLTNAAIQDFFGPLEGSQGSHYANKGAGAMAVGSYTQFMYSKMLDDASIYTHEMVHNSDGLIYFGGYGRRFGQRAELFAQGLLQAPYHANTENFGINSIFDYRGTSSETAENRYQALTPERFQTSADLQTYFKGMFDVLYTLDKLEADAILALSKEEQRRFFNKIENYYVKDTVLNIDTHAGNRIRKFTDEEWAKMNLTTVEDLVDHDVISHRQFSLNADNQRDYNRNGYYDIPMFSPIYSALDNPNGAPGDIMFRRMAFELLAEKGYQDGLLPYISDQYSSLAKERGSLGTETWPSPHTVGRVTDSLVLEQVFKGEYQDWKAFKKAMFQRRAEQLANLKPVSINYKGGTVDITSSEQLKTLMQEAVNEDLQRFLGTDEAVKSAQNNNSYARASRVKELKAKIFNAYLRQTDDFRTSIYNN
ncbi:LPXTG-motif cell wall-anchored protein [Streptococcus rupicaprae]|uniref:LPXTG-motif cell wall-anchored protein n=1 Tax=Streptococcus rupicaprae TaxID=759619 RepID=A0ABV2FKV2_9STRE